MVYRKEDGMVYRKEDGMVYRKEDGKVYRKKAHTLTCNCTCSRVDPPSYTDADDEGL